MKRMVFSLVAAALLFASPAMAGGYRVGIYGGIGPYYPPPYPVYRPYYYGPAYYPYPPPPPPVYYPPYPAYPGFGVGYFSPGFSFRFGR